MKDKTKPKVHKFRVTFYVDRKSRFVHDAVLFMLLSAIFRVVGCWGLWNDRFFTITQIILPISCNLLFILCLRLLGDKAFPSTIVPVILGVAFFIIKALGFENMLHTVLCIVLYVAVAVIYTTTALGIIRTKWLLVPLFGLPFIYHVAVEDLAALRDTLNPVLFTDGMQELSVLSIMLALIFTALAMKKRKIAIEDPSLPRIKDPVVVVPPKPAQTSESAENVQTTQTQQLTPSQQAEETTVADTQSQQDEQAESPDETQTTENKSDVNSSNTEM